MVRTRCWSGGDSNRRSSLRSLYSGDACVALDFNARGSKKTAQRSFSDANHRLGRAENERISNGIS